VDTATNRLATLNGFTVLYDAAGNQINDGSGPRTYDAENRMLTATKGGVSSSYAYDADGRRVRRIIGAQETWQIYGIGGELLAEYAVGASPTTPQKEYGYRGGQMLVVWDGGETGDRQLQWLVQDHLGSTRMVVDRSGSLGGIKRHDFAPFGAELSAGVGIRSASNGYSVDSVRQKFGSYERDNETGLDYAQARYYDNRQGRFLSVDPLISSGRPSSPQSWNRYSYVGNHPLELTDPTGLIWAKKGDQYKWFDKDIPDGWKAVTEFVFWGGDVGWVALNPIRNEGQAGFETKFQALKARDSMLLAADPASPYSNYDGAGEVAAYIGAAGAIKSLGAAGLRMLMARAIATGAREMTVAEAEAAWAAAKVEYEAIRNAAGDVEAIAQNTGWAASRIARIKDHIFFRTHQLRDGVARFDADPEIASAWRRLQSGAHTEKDIQLLRHEIFESKFEGIFKTS